MSGARGSGFALPPDVEVRVARPDDARGAARVQIQGWRDTYADLVSAEFLAAFDEDAATERYAGAARPDRAGFQVAERAGRIVGLALAGEPREEPDPPRDLQLWILYVERDQHGTGIGQALLDAVLGDRPAFLWVADPNPRAQAFYRRNGFVADGARTTDPRWEDIPEIRMVR